MMKRIIALALLAALVLPVLPVAAATTPSLTVETSTVTQGSSVSLSVTAADLVSLGTLELALYYDSAALSVSSVTAGGLFSSEMFDYNADEAGVIRVNCVSFAGVSGSGTVLTVIFTASSTASGTYPITLAVGDCYNASLQPVEVSSTSGSITVNEKEVSNGSFTLYQYLSSSDLKKGDSLTVSVRSPYNAYSAIDFLMEYDRELLQLESVELHDSLQIEGAVWSVNTDIQGAALICYASTKELSNYYKFTAVFTVIGDADTTTTISTTAKNVYKADLTAYTPYTTTSTLSLSKTPEVTDHKNLTVITDTLAVGGTGATHVVLEQGAGVAAGDFTVTYDPSLLLCAGVTAGTELCGGSVIINPNYEGGTIKFSYINQAGVSESDIELITVSWEALAAPTAHYSPTAEGADVVDVDYNPITLEQVAQASCFYGVQVVAPTCTQDGYTAYSCPCGDSYTESPVPSTGHSYTDGLCSACGRQVYALLVENGSQTEYTDLQQAVNDCTEGYLKLVGNCPAAITVPHDLQLDLNGYDLTGTVTVAQGATLYGFDSANDGYDASLCGSVAAIDGNFAMDHRVSGKRYIALQNENGVSFHRLYVGITHMSLKPNSAAFGYKAAFYADDVLSGCISSYGYELSIDMDGTTPVVCDLDNFTSGKVLTLRVQNVMTQDQSHSKNAAAATTDLTAAAFITLENGGKTVTLYSQSCSASLVDMLETLDGIYPQLDESKQQSLKAFTQSFSSALTAAGCQFDNL